MSGEYVSGGILQCISTGKLVRNCASRKNRSRSTDINVVLSFTLPARARVMTDLRYCTLHCILSIYSITLIAVVVVQCIE